jgi:hypothetical protein
MNPNLSKEVLSRLDAIAAKLGVAANVLWAAYLRQARVEGISDALTALLLLALGIGFWRLAKWTWSIGQKQKEYDRGGWQIATVLIAISAPFLIFPTGYYLYCAFSELYNPQFWAISQILQQLK